MPLMRFFSFTNAPLFVRVLICFGRANNSSRRKLKRNNFVMRAETHRRLELARVRVLDVWTNALKSIRINLNDRLFYGISMRRLRSDALHRFPNGPLHSHDAALARQTAICLISICATYALEPFLLGALRGRSGCTCEFSQTAGYISLIARVDCRAGLHICGLSPLSGNEVSKDLRR